MTAELAHVVESTRITHVVVPTTLERRRRPIAEKAIASGSPVELVDFLTTAVRSEVEARFDAIRDAEKSASRSVDDRRAYVEAVLGLQVWSHKLYGAMKAGPHAPHGHG